MDLFEALSNRSRQVRRLLEHAQTWPTTTRRRRTRPRPVRIARQLTPDDVDQLVAAYQAGATVYDLAQQFKIHRITVGKHLRARGIDTRPPALTPSDVEVAAQLYRQGWSLSKIAKRYGVSADTIRLHLIQAGVEIRRRWERGRPDCGSTSVQVRPLR